MGSKYIHTDIGPLIDPNFPLQKFSDEKIYCDNQTETLECIMKSAILIQVSILIPILLFTCF